MCSPPTDTVEDFSSALFPVGRSGSSPEDFSPVGGLPMAQYDKHIPVLLEEVLDLFTTIRDGIVIDATLGDGGHAAALLGALPNVRLIGVDRDASAIEAAGQNLASFGDRVVLAQARFSEIATGRLTGFTPRAQSNEERTQIELDELNVCGVLFDLGVRSAQIDQSERGFSYRCDGTIDMRMDRDAGVPASVIVNEESESYLAKIFADNGERRFARRIAKAIVQARPLASTAELAAIVDRSIPASARRRGHPATRVFQALRVVVNEEAEELAVALPAALDLLCPRGRCVVISYHSGEDRFVKSTFIDAATGGCTCPANLPCVCGAHLEYELVFRGSVKATQEECDANPRSKSARLRAIERKAGSAGHRGTTDPEEFTR